MELVVRDSSPRFAERSKDSFHDSHHVVFLSDFHSKRLAALSGAGFGWLPLHLVGADLEAGRLVRVAAEKNRWTYHPSLVHRSDRPLGRAAQLFRETLLAASKHQMD